MFRLRNNRSTRQQNGKVHFSHWSFRSAKTERALSGTPASQVRRSGFSHGEVQSLQIDPARAQRILWTSCWLVISRLKTLAGLGYHAVRTVRRTAFAAVANDGVVGRM